MVDLGIEAGVLFFLAVMYQVWLASRHGMLWPSQMVEKYSVGFPLVANGTVWGCALLLPFAFGIIVATCGEQWGKGDALSALAFGVFMSIEMIQEYVRGKFPDALAGPNGLSPAGAVLVIYMAAGFMLILLFCQSASPRWATLLVGAILALHMLAANHVPLAALRSEYLWKWCPDVFKEEGRPLFVLAVTESLIGAVTAVKLIFPGSLLKLFH